MLDRARHGPVERYLGLDYINSQWLADGFGLLGRLAHSNTFSTIHAVKMTCPHRLEIPAQTLATLHCANRRRGLPSILYKSIAAFRQQLKTITYGLSSIIPHQASGVCDSIAKGGQPLLKPPARQHRRDDGAES